MKLVAFVKNIKIVHKPATETTDAFDVLEFKVESTDTEYFARVCSLEKGKLRITLEPDQTELAI